MLVKYHRICNIIITSTRRTNIVNSNHRQVPTIIQHSLAIGYTANTHRVTGP